jgi:hypothetical protein
MMVATVDADRAFRRGQRPVQALQDALAAIPLELLVLRDRTFVRIWLRACAVLCGAAALAGNDAEAQRWLQHGLIGSPQELAYRAPIHLELARLYERMGDRVAPCTTKPLSGCGTRGSAVAGQVEEARQR